MSKREQREGEGGTGGATQSMCGNYKSFKGTNLTVVEGMHQFIVYILYSRTTGEEMAECSKGGFPTALGRIDVYQ